MLDENCFPMVSTYALHLFPAEPHWYKISLCTMLFTSFEVSHSAERTTMGQQHELILCRRLHPSLDAAPKVSALTEVAPNPSASISLTYNSPRSVISIFTDSKYTTYMIVS
jgi:hypothetical protein